MELLLMGSYRRGRRAVARYARFPTMLLARGGNPQSFDQTVMEGVVRNIVDSLRRAPRPFLVVYLTALYADGFRRNGFRELGRRSDAPGNHLVFEAPAAAA